MTRTRTMGHARLRMAIAAFGVVLLGGSLLASNASAVLSGTLFEGNDGNLNVNTSGNTDWANVANRTTGIDKPSGGSDNAFGNGSKEDNAAVSVTNGSIPPNKNDLTRFYIASALEANGHTYLQLAWERLVNIGSANLDFEINQNKTTGFTDASTGAVTLNRTAGDLLVTYDFGGSGAPTLGLNTWLTSGAGNTASQCFSANKLPCWGLHMTLGSGSAEGAVNSASVTDPFLPVGSQTLGAGLFGEASIDLTASNVFSPGVCEAFGSAFVKSRSSTSFTAELKDFIAPQDVSISNCASISITKVTENGDSDFGFTASNTLSPSTFSLSNGETQTFNAVSLGSYTVTEDDFTAAQTAAGWTFKSLNCTTTGTGTSATKTGDTANITVGPGGTVSCTYTNHINASPTISTLLSSATTTIGGSITDSSTLTGATANAGGTVTYHAYAGANTCTGTDLLADPVNHTNTVSVTNGVVPDSPAFVPTTAGTYSFQAVYSGDANNNTATSVCADEQLAVSRNTTSVSTAQTLTPNDSFTLSGATSGAGGSVTFNLYAPTDATCSGTPALTETVSVSGNGTYSTTNTAFTATAAGTWRWKDVYTGDTNNFGITSPCGTEQFTIANS